MKILAFVDLHGSLNALKKIMLLARKEDVDLILCAGDITIFGDSIDSLIKKIDSIGKPVLMIHGNHESESLLRPLCEKSKNIIFIHKGIFEKDDYVFMGYGGGGFSTRDNDFESWSKNAIQKIGEYRKIILITHAPPYGTKLDLILDQPAGSKSIRQFIKLVQPRLAISGHLHENAGVKDRIDRTKVINPGPWGVIVSV